ncbi:MAG: heme-binding beta-barrel domain-containing protein [Acidimicrobiales bacterium]
MATGGSIESRSHDRADPYGSDLFTEARGDPRTLAHLGPLAPMAGVFEGAEGVDVHPAAGGAERDAYVERYELQPVDRQTNGPQLFYGLRYHTHIVRPREIETFHDQVGHWLWEPARRLITFTLSVPRGQAALATGHAEPDATEFEVSAHRGSPINGILSNEFLERAFRTVSFTMRVRIGSGDTWSYTQETVLEVEGVGEPFSHTDENTLVRVASPSPNPMAAAS